jgi:hypothetical protein
MEKATNFLTASKLSISNVLKQEVIMTILKVFFILYGASIAPTPPPFMKSTLSNTFVKIVLIALAVLTVNVNFSLALIISITVVLGSNFLSNRGLLESFEGYPRRRSTVFSKKYVVQNSARLLEPRTNIYQGCEKTTLKDLLNVFKGDRYKLQKTVKYAFAELMAKATGDDKTKLLQMARASGLPYNVKINDENAPFIATLMVQWGYNFGGSCKM